MTAALQLDQVVKHFPGPRRGTKVHAVNDVSFSVAPGETVALVGESGSGKTTLGRLALQLERVTSGRVLLEGRDITQLSQSALRALRPHMQMVFQDPWGNAQPSNEDPVSARGAAQAAHPAQCIRAARAHGGHG